MGMLLEPARWRGKIYIGDWVAGSGPEYPVREPATGGELGVLGSATPADVRTAAARGKEASIGWAARSHEERAAILRRAGDLFAECGGEISDWIIREAGSVGPKAGFEIGMASSSCYSAAGLASLPYGQLIRSSQARLSLTRRLPVGVVGVIAPFNVPLVLAIRYVAPALALGNSVLLKPDPRTAVSGGVALARIFEEAGLPAGVLGVLPGGADVGQALIADPEVNVIVFTGSTRAGRAVARLAGEHLKRVHLELGGNSAFVILDDADLDKAVSAGAFGSFFHQGQVCMAASRHLVDARIAREYTERLVEHARALKVGNPATEDHVAIGPMIDAGQRDRVHQLVTSSIAGGAQLATGGTFEGLFYQPTVLSGVGTDAPAYAEEIFGPVAPVTTFSSLEEAARLASGTPYGLSLGIVTRDVMKGLRLADQIPTGLVHINDQPIHDEPTVPFGGVKQSGAGSHLGGYEANLEAFTELQWVTLRGDVPPYPF
jgi:benzaldehyde dehydrogenase (NAD)